MNNTGNKGYKVIENTTKRNMQRYKRNTTKGKILHLGVNDKRYVEKHTQTNYIFTMCNTFSWVSLGEINTTGSTPFHTGGEATEAHKIYAKSGTTFSLGKHTNF